MSTSPAYFWRGNKARCSHIKSIKRRRSSSQATSLIFNRTRSRSRAQSLATSVQNYFYLILWSSPLGMKKSTSFKFSNKPFSCLDLENDYIDEADFEEDLDYLDDEVFESQGCCSVWLDPNVTWFDSRPRCLNATKYRVFGCIFLLLSIETFGLFKVIAKRVVISVCDILQSPLY